MTNVVRHAPAHQAWLDLRESEEELELVIRDDGQGFDPAAARQRALQGASSGLLGMQERVELLGGRIDIVSEPGQGTTIRAHFPVPSKPARLVATSVRAGGSTSEDACGYEG